MISLSHGGTSIYACAGPVRKMLVATVDGVVTLSRDADAAPWQVSADGLQGSHIVGIAIEPQSGAVIATSHNAGVAVSEDGAATWQPRNEGLAPSNVYSVVCARSNGHMRLYAGTEPTGLYVSDDLGRQWTEMPALTSVPGNEEWMFPLPPNDAHLKNITVDTHDPQVLYASVEQGALLRSRDAGNSWEIFDTVDADVHRVLLKSDKRTIFAPTGMGVYRSDDNGANWINISQQNDGQLSQIGYPDPIVCDPNNEQLMFVAGAASVPPTWIPNKSANSKIARSRDGGEHWQIVNNGLPPVMDGNFEAMALAAWDGGCEVYLGTTAGEVFASHDEGENWHQIVNGIPAVSKSLHYVIAHGDMEMAIATPDRFK